MSKTKSKSKKSHASSSKSKHIAIITHDPQHTTLAILFSVLIVLFIFGVFFIKSYQ